MSVPTAISIEFKRQVAQEFVAGETLYALAKRHDISRQLIRVAPGDIAVRRRHDAGDALRGGPHHAGALDEVVMAQGLGDADRQAPRDEKGDRGAGTPVGRDHAPHLG
jgi:transposase